MITDHGKLVSDVTSKAQLQRAMPDLMGQCLTRRVPPQAESPDISLRLPLRWLRSTGTLSAVKPPRERS